MTKTEIKSIHTEINNAVAAILAKHNLQTNGSSITYGESDFTYKLKVNILDSDTGVKKVSKQMISNASYLFFKNSYDVKAEVVESLFGMEIKTPTVGTIKLVDVDTKKFKYPFIVQSDNGNRYKMSAGQILNYSKMEYKFSV